MPSIFPALRNSARPEVFWESTLEGTVYRFRAGYVQVIDAWVLDIADANNSPLLIGSRIVQGYPLTGDHSDVGLPPGVIFAADPTGDLDGSGPHRQDFRGPARLVYITSTEVADGVTIGSLSG